MNHAWRPSPQDIEWTRNLLDGLRDGGSWVTPTNGNIYTVNKKDRSIACDAKNIADDTDYRVLEVLARLGYSVKKPENYTESSFEEYM